MDFAGSAPHLGRQPREISGPRRRNERDAGGIPCSLWVTTAVLCHALTFEPGACLGPRPLGWESVRVRRERVDDTRGPGEQERFFPILQLGVIAKPAAALGSRSSCCCFGGRHWPAVAGAASGRSTALVDEPQEDEQAMKRTNLLLTVLSAATVTVVMLATTALPVSADGGDRRRRRQRGSERWLSTNGQIVFRRYFDAEQTQGRPLRHRSRTEATSARSPFPQSAGGTTFPHGLPMERRSSSSASRADESTSRIMVVNPDTGETRTVVPCTGETNA